MVLGITNSNSLLQCPAEAQQVRKCNGFRSLKQLLKDRDKKTEISDMEMIIRECEQRAVSAVYPCSTALDRSIAMDRLAVLAEEQSLLFL
jgi:peroxiredoxin family protein